MSKHRITVLIDSSLLYRQGELRAKDHLASRIGSDVERGLMVGDGVELRLVLRGATKLNAMISRPAGSSIRELPARKGRRRLP